MYWCYSADFVDKVCKHLARKTLYDGSAIKVKNGNTNNISIFVFPGSHQCGITTLKHPFVGTK